MTETQTPRPDLTITARADDRWVVTFTFNDTPVGFVSDAVMTLVDDWGMDFTVADAVIVDLWNEATSEDGNDVAEVVLSENPS